MYLANRISKIEESIFATMSKLAIENNAINLGQGFPDFDGPDWIKDKAYEAMKMGKNQYAPMIGILNLRKALSEIRERFYQQKYDYDEEITITAGATEALFCSFNAFIDPGDEVILFEPFYDSYSADVLLSGGIPIYVTLHKPDFYIDFDELRKSITNKTKMIVINNPHNPTGKVFTYDELEEISRIANDYNLLVISDEVYEFLLYDNAKHIPISTFEGMNERCITISSSGKTFGMTGWKVGFAFAKYELTKAIRKVHQWTTFAVNTPAQHAMAYAFSNIDNYLPDFKRIYQSKRNLLINHLKDSIFNIHKPQGTYFAMIDIPEKIKLNDIEFAEKLVKEYKIATIPPSVFYGKSNEGNTMLRLCFAKNDQTLIQGISKLKEITF